MGLSKAERRLISLGTREILDRLNFNRDIAREINSKNARRAKIGDHFRQRILKRAFNTVGLDYGVILQRQSKEFESALKDLETFNARMEAHSKRVSQRHQQLFKRLRKAKMMWHSGSVNIPPGPAPGPIQPTLVGYIPTPTHFDLQDMGTPQNATITVIETGANRGTFLQFDWSTRVVDQWNPFITATFNYLWTPPQDGSMGIFSLAAYNGVHYWAFSPTCGYPPFLDVSFDSSITIQQIDSFGHVFTEMSPVSGGIHDGHEGGCLPDSGHKAYDFIDYLQTQSPFLVEKNVPVMITITITGDCAGLMGVAGELNFSTKSGPITQAIALPGILFGFTPS